MDPPHPPYVPLVDSALSMQTPASVASGVMSLLVEESGEGHRLTHAYILLHTDACEYTHNGKPEHSLNLFPSTEKRRLGDVKHWGIGKQRSRLLLLYLLAQQVIES